MIMLTTLLIVTILIITILISTLTLILGDESFDLAADLMDEKKYKDAADLYWKAVLLTTGNKVQYTLEEAYMNFMKCYQLMNQVDEGYLYIAKGIVVLLLL